MKLKIGETILDVRMDAQDVQLIRSKTPVITGNLRDGFHLTPEGEIENLVDYGPKVELGTSNTPGRFMVTQSIPEIQRRLEKKIIKQLRGQKVIKDFTINIRLAM